jgi:hypothetical protein
VVQPGTVISNPRTSSASKTFTDQGLLFLTEGVVRRPDRRLPGIVIFVGDVN